MGDKESFVEPASSSSSSDEELENDVIRKLKLR
jgi:hypothetical protein